MDARPLPASVRSRRVSQELGALQSFRRRLGKATTAVGGEQPYDRLGHAR